MRKRFQVSIATIVLILALVAYIFLPSVLPTSSTIALPYKKGSAASYAYGSSSYVQFALQRPAILTGGYLTNAGATLEIVQLTQPTTSDVCRDFVNPYYSIGPLNQATVNVMLDAGTYLLAFTFTNKTSLQTWLNITQSFVATYV